MKLRELFSISLLALGSVYITESVANPASMIDRPAVMSVKSSRSLLTDIAYAGKRLVAVGERGHILYSDDQGKTWVQAKVPVSAMLTGLSFPNAQEGWAVGHSGVILYTSDAGATWRLQRSDKSATDEKAGVPLMDVWFADNVTGFAVGAYGYFLKTTDGGTTWSDVSASIDNPDEAHLNAVMGIPGTTTILVGGERGILFRSQDKGETWISLSSPFEGSFFGISPISSDLLLAYGLQGRVFRSANQGDSWSQVQTGVTSGINDAVRLESGRIVAVGNAGVVLSAHDSSLNFIPETREDRQSIVALQPLPGGGAVTVGEGGVKVLPAGK
ncbi:MAG TPA: YCF48-related protein [Moraxellaceae bacterium]|nr:YCF48-related protein [Moraxellaceae bacterium]